MNLARNVTHLTAIVATAAAAFTTQAADVVTTVQLEPVTVTAHRRAESPLQVRLETVVVTGRRQAADAPLQARLPKVVVTARRAAGSPVASADRNVRAATAPKAAV